MFCLKSTRALVCKAHCGNATWSGLSLFSLAGSTHDAIEFTVVEPSKFALRTRVNDDCSGAIVGMVLHQVVASRAVQSGLKLFGVDGFHGDWSAVRSGVTASQLRGQCSKRFLIDDEALAAWAEANLAFLDRADFKVRFASLTEKTSLLVG